MQRITRSVIKLSELPQHLQKDKIFFGHKTHTYAEYHVGKLDIAMKNKLALYLVEKYPTITRKISFLIHIDKPTSQRKEHQQQQTIEEVFEWLTKNNYVTDLKETLIEQYKNQ
jgi:hypothetical protein